MEQVPSTRPDYTYHYKCDVCGYESTDSSRFNEIVIQLDPEECVSFTHHRIYCWEHADVWVRLCELLGVDPEAMSDGDEE
jgi:hypothetical protein